MNFKTFLTIERRGERPKKILVNADKILRVSNDVPSCSLILHMKDKDVPIFMHQCAQRRSNGETIGEYELFQEFRRRINDPET